MFWDKKQICKSHNKDTCGIIFEIISLETILLRTIQNAIVLEMLKLNI